MTTMRSHSLLLTLFLLTLSLLTPFLLTLGLVAPSLVAPAYAQAESAAPAAQKRMNSHAPRALAATMGGATKIPVPMTTPAMTATQAWTLPFTTGFWR